MELVPQDQLKKTYRMTIFIGFAMIVSVFFYALMAEFLKANSDFLPQSRFTYEREVLKYVLLAVAIAEFLLIWFIRKIILSGNPKDIAQKISRLQISSIVTFCLCESVAVYGLLVFFLTKDSMDFYIFLLLSLIYFAFYFPRYSQWEEWIKASEGRNYGANS
jgi:F0F1-type ATP synthase membrane subunit c/vacuolar-type H+-ATPase subunit K